MGDENYANTVIVEENGVERLVPINFGFAYIFVPFNKLNTPFLVFFQTSGSGAAQDLQVMTANKIKYDLIRHNIYCDIVSTDGDRYWFTQRTQFAFERILKRYTNM